MGREKAYECFTAGRARNVDAFVAELHVLAQVPTMQNNDVMAPIIDARVQVPQSRRKKVCMMPFSSFTVLVVFVPIAALWM